MVVILLLKRELWSMFVIEGSAFSRTIIKGSTLDSVGYVIFKGSALGYVGHAIIGHIGVGC